MRRLVQLTVSCAVLPVLGACAGSSSGGACAQPHVDASPDRVRAGAEVVLTAGGLIDACDDQGLGETGPPMRDEPVSWTQRGHTSEIGSASADESGRLRMTVRVPTTAAPGPAEIAVGWAEPVRITVLP